MAGLTVLWRVEPEGRRYRWWCGICPSTVPGATGTAGTQHEAEQRANGHVNREHGEVGK